MATTVLTFYKYRADRVALASRKTNSRQVLHNTRRHITMNLFTQHINVSSQSPSISPKQFHFKNYKSCGIWFWLTHKHRLRNHRSFWDQVDTRHLAEDDLEVAMKTDRGHHYTDGGSINLPFGLANCILQRWYRRCPPPHQLWAWWPGCRCFLVLCGWTVGKRCLK